MPPPGVTGKMGVVWWEILPSLAVLWMGWCKGDGGGNVDSVVSDPESGSDGNRQIVHACLVGGGLEITCEGRERVGDISSRNTTWWEGCLISAARQVGG